MVQYTLAFDECDSVDPQRLGGKCASLVALTAARVPVPPGFVLTSEAYAALLAVDGLNHRLECGAAGRACSTPEQSFIGLIMASPITTCLWRSVCRRW